MAVSSTMNAKNTKSKSKSKAKVKALDVFKWQGLNRKGKKVGGELSAASLLELKAQLRKQGITPGKISKKAKPLFEKALTINPLNTPSLFFMAQQALLKFNVKQARFYYQAILKINQKNLSALRSILQLTFEDIQEPNWDDFLSIIELSDVTDDQIVAIVDTMFRWKNYQGIEDFLATIKPQAQWSDLVWMVWLKNNYFLSQINLEQEKVNEHFLKNYEIFNRENKLPEHVMFALSILEQNNQFDLVLTLIEKQPTSIRYSNAAQLTKASAFIALNQDKAAEEVLISLSKKKQVLSGAQWYVWGRIMEYRNDLDQAANYYTAYHKSSPGFISVTRLAKVLLKTNRTDELAFLSKEYITKHPADSSARISLAFKLASSHSELALKFLKTEHVHWLVMKNWTLSNNMAALYLMQNDAVNALTYSANALVLNPNNTSVKQLHEKINTMLKTTTRKTYDKTKQQ